MADEAGGARNKRLGRGLAALIGDVSSEAPSGSDASEAAAVLSRSGGIRTIPIEYIRPNPRNPRKTFSEDDLSDLIESVREKGGRAADPRASVGRRQGDVRAYRR